MISFKRRCVAHAIFGLGVVMMGSHGARADVFSIATADESKAGEYSFSLDQEGDGSHLRSPQTLRVFAAQYAVTRRMLLGLDAQVSGRERVLPNISVMLTSEGSQLRVAAGYANVGLRSFGEQAFIVASGDVQHFTLHGGFTRTAGRSYPMLGVERPLTSSLTAKADYISGEGNFLTVGGELQVSKRVSFAAAWMIANRHADTNGLYLDVQWAS